MKEFDKQVQAQGTIISTEGKIAYHSYVWELDGSLWFIQYDFNGKEDYRTCVRKALPLLNNYETA